MDLILSLYLSVHLPSISTSVLFANTTQHSVTEIRNRLCNLPTQNKSVGARGATGRGSRSPHEEGRKFASLTIHNKMARRPDFREKLANEFFHIILVVNILNTILPCKATVQSHGQGECVQTVICAETKENEALQMGDIFRHVPSFCC